MGACTIARRVHVGCIYDHTCGSVGWTVGEAEGRSIDYYERLAMRYACGSHQQHGYVGLEPALHVNAGGHESQRGEFDHFGTNMIKRPGNAFEGHIRC